jgi:hypothetical protein
MKNIFFIFLLTMGSIAVSAQDFNKSIASAKGSYSSGDLENARFAMQQMITDLDMLIGKEILKLLPAKMDVLASNVKADNVTANTGLAGVVVHREYGSAEKIYNIDIMGNSPMVASINAILSLPFIGNSGDGTQKVVKIAGYKSMLQKSTDSETNKTDFTIQIPLNSTLLTFTVPDSNEADVLKMANTIPVQEIAKMVQ